MRISKLISLMLCIFVLSCTTNDQEDVLTPQESDLTLQNTELNFQEADLTFSKEETETLDKLFAALHDNPDYFDQSIEGQMAFLATFLSQSGYNVDLKNYEQYVHQDNWSEAKTTLSTKIDDYVYQIDDYALQAGINNSLPNKLDKLEKDIISSNPKITQEEAFRIKSEVALWKYLSTSESFASLYNAQISPENAKVNWKCILNAAKFGLNFTLCALGKIYACFFLPADVAFIAKDCGKKSQPAPCVGPCCGVYCSQGYRCENGKCVKDIGSAPCSNCGDGEQCINGICEPL